METYTAPVATEAPEAPQITLTHVKFRGVDHKVEKDVVSGESFIMVNDDKVGTIKVSLNQYTEGDKAGMLYCTPEYGSHDDILKSVDGNTEIIVNAYNAFLRGKLGQRATASFNAKAGPKSDDLTKKTYLLGLSQQDNFIVTADDAVDYRPFERGESDAGFQRQQRELMKTMSECQPGSAKWLECINGITELTTRRQAFWQRQVAELQNLAAASRTGAE